MSPIGPKPEFFANADAAHAQLPFSEAVRVGDLLFVSGQIGTSPGTLELVPGGIGPETEQALANLRTILARRGAELRDIVKCTVFLADVGEWAAFNDAYVRCLPRPLPARSALGGCRLALGARVEVECVAVVPADRSAAAP